MKKKVLSFVTALTLISSMSLPLVNAQEGSFNVENDLKTPVMNIVVPTDFSFAVNTARIDDKGSSITSSDFYIINKSETPVSANVGIKLTAASSKTISFKSTSATCKAGTGGWGEEANKNDAYFALATATEATVTSSKTAPKINNDDVKAYALKYDGENATNSASNIYCYATVAPTGFPDIYVDLDDNADHTDKTKYTWEEDSTETATLSTAGALDASTIKYYKSSESIDSFIKARADTDTSLLNEVPLATTYNSVKFALNAPSTKKTIKIHTDAALTDEATSFVVSTPVADVVTSENKADGKCNGTSTSFRFVGLVNPDLSWSENDIKATVQYRISPVSVEDYEAVTLVEDTLGYVSTAAAWTELASPTMSKYDENNGVFTLTNLSTSKTYTASVTGGGNTNTEAVFSDSNTKLTINPGWKPVFEKVEIYEGSVENGKKVLTITRSEAIPET